MKQILVLVLPFMFTMPVSAADPRPVGYVDMQVVLDTSEMGRQAQKALEEKFSGRQRELAEEEQSIRQLQQTLARDEALMSQTELDKKKSEIQARVQTFQQKAAQAQKEVVQEQNKLASEILKPAQTIIASVAKDKQVSAVFERRQSGLMYVDEGLDLTAEVIKRLDAQKKK